jgi:hypothetical protein
VLIGPGGAFAVETKWSAEPWNSSYGKRRVAEAVAQAERNARLLRLWHPFKSRNVPVQPILVLWSGGSARTADREPIQVIDGVAVIAGRAIQLWGRDLGAGVLGEEQVREAWAALDAHAIRRDAHDDLLYRQPASFTAWAVRTGAVIGAFIAGFLLPATLVDRTGASLWTLGAGVVATVPAIFFIKVGVGRLAAWGWLAGVGLPAIAIVLAGVVFRPG